MNEFYQDLLETFMYRWVKQQSGVQACTNCCTLCICHNQLHGTIRFHKEKIVELMIKDQSTDENIFYLHFQMHDMKSTLEQFQTFFCYLKGNQQQHYQSDIKESQIHKILLSCSGGLTTSYFAYAIQEILDERKLDIRVDAVGYSEIDHLADEYDLILLAPQIAYMLPQFQQKYGHKMMTIEALDFATSHFEDIIEKAIH